MPHIRRSQQKEDTKVGDGIRRQNSNPEIGADEFIHIPAGTKDQA